MAEKNIKSRNGFTIIEVVLVLAIAGLIFLMVFIAWPALQRSQRDTQRRNDYSMLSTAITNYSTNNGGKLTKLLNGGTSAELNASTFVNKDGLDPNGNMYELTVYKNVSALEGKRPVIISKGKSATCSVKTADGNKINDPAVCESAGGTWTPETKASTQVFVVLGADCAGTSSDGYATPKTAAATSTRAFAVYGALETGTYCQASQ